MEGPSGCRATVPCGHRHQCVTAFNITLARDHTITKAMAKGLLHLENRTVEYQFDDADFAARYAAIKEGGGDDLRSEIALLRLLIERAAPSVPALAGSGQGPSRGTGPPPAGRRTARPARPVHGRIGNLRGPCRTVVGLAELRPTCRYRIPPIHTAIATAGRDQPREPLRLTHDPQASGE